MGLFVLSMSENLMKLCIDINGEELFGEYYLIQVINVFYYVIHRKRSFKLLILPYLNSYGIQDRPTNHWPMLRIGAKIV